MSDTKTHTITFKGPQNGEPWLVLGGENTEGLEAALWSTFPELDESLSLPEAVWRAHALWAATRAVVLGTAPGAGQAPTAPSGPPVPSQGQYQPTPPPDPNAGPPAPSCQHGPRVWKTGTSAKTGKAWKGWFCSAQQGDPSQCKPQFV